jgi:hypothetical protein
LLHLPEPLHDCGCLGGEADEQGEIAFGEPPGHIAVEIDHSEHLAVVLHWHGQLGLHRRPDPHVPRVFAHIGDELRTPVKRDPTGDALAEPEDDLAVVVGQTPLGFNLQPPGVGIEQGDGARVGGKVLDQHIEHPMQGGRGVIDLGRERGDAVKGNLVRGTRERE